MKNKISGSGKRVEPETAMKGMKVVKPGGETIKGYPVISGVECVEFVGDDGESVIIPLDPEKAYGDLWRGWCDFLGNDNVDEVCEGMTPTQRAKELEHVRRNREGRG